jgi:hypothetical protein
VAGALNFIGRDTLYGRYWGCVEHHPCLHFELCYYQAIDFAIAHGLARVEAGAQGEHKLARGYLPVTTHSLHWVADAGSATPSSSYLEAERAAVDQEIEVLTSYGPFRKARWRNRNDRKLSEETRKALARCSARLGHGRGPRRDHQTLRVREFRRGLRLDDARAIWAEK